MVGRRGYWEGCNGSRNTFTVLMIDDWMILDRVTTMRDVFFLVFFVFLEGEWLLYVHYRRREREQDFDKACFENIVFVIFGKMIFFYGDLGKFI